MSKEEIDFTQDPRKVFLVFLIRELSAASFYLFHITPAQEMKALDIMDGIISSLDKKSQDTLKALHEKIRNGAYTNSTPLTSKEIRAAYQELSIYLHETFLKEAIRAHPLYRKKGHLGVPT